jgi:hypothetical protein
MDEEGRTLGMIRGNIRADCTLRDTAQFGHVQMSGFADFGHIVAYWKTCDHSRVTLVLFRTRRRDGCSRLKEGLRRRVRKSRQKEAAGAADAGLMQIECSEQGV